MHETSAKHLGEAAMALEGWGNFQLPALAGKMGRESKPPWALQSRLGEGSLNLVGSGAIAAGRSIPSSADW